MSQMNDDQQEIEIEAIGIEVDTQPIELYKVLKLANAVSGGGEAKYAIAEGYVAVNGELETRKRRKLYDGDLVEFNQEYYLVICEAPISEPAEPQKPAKGSTKEKTPSSRMSKPKERKLSKKQEKKSTNKKKQPNKTQAKAKETIEETPPSTNGGRSAIRFF
ncbi:RNA-binding S4 domain-containing protein [Vibrio cincinnatiensis]|uniref:RNA-binding S4 domain-containing protein n=1 Tax=Vibrio cincinnatiensis TaxID=675 RepID=UPI001EDF0BEF|nr:RNA-binding S4 domain-containing protein [Vibrio cincinnatiensis]MCG3729136.1 RNA-binding S4 domain-containing protein [Vibrio cincinnatiensis]